MSFWGNVWKFTQPYGDDEYDVYEGYEGYEEEEAPRRSRAAEPEAEENTGAAEPAKGAAAPKAGFNGQVLNMNANKQEVVLFRPDAFNDCTKAADDLRDRKAIIVNMENVDKALSRRVVDFLSGCAYSLDGKVTKIAQATYLFSPMSVDVSGTLENVQPETETYI